MRMTTRLEYVPGCTRRPAEPTIYCRNSVGNDQYTRLLQQRALLFSSLNTVRIDVGNSLLRRSRAY